ncbi:MAG: cytochrome d ubiquinol oxidase subunit II [Vampirovibrionia bacterium]
MLETIWFILWCVLWSIYFMLDGFDLGIGMLTPVLGKTESRKNVLYKSTGPFWDGNEVWLITAGGVTFAAFPTTYAIMFSALYSPLMLILFSLILRGVSVEFKGKINNKIWNKTCDILFFISSLLAALLFGVAFANIFSGIPIDADGIFKGTILSLLTPYGILGGILFISLFLIHGSIWATIKTENDLQEDCIKLFNKLWPVLMGIVVIFLAYTPFATKIMNNYLESPFLFVIPVICIIALVLVKVFFNKKEYWKAWSMSCLTIVNIVLTGLVGIYPSLLPSSINNAFDLTIFNSSSSPLTLKIMLGVVLVFLPFILAYQTWAYILFKDKVKENPDKDQVESY